MPARSPGATHATPGRDLTLVGGEALDTLERAGVRPRHRARICKT